MTDLSPPYHYQVIRRALDIIDTSKGPMALDDLARTMGMSPAHFQRTFSQWVGISPKRYQQYLTLDHARWLLANRSSLLETALSSGLSGSGRLHDLFLTWEAMTPGEYAKAGEGLQIFWGWFESPFGPAIVMGTERGICGMGFAAEMGAEVAFRDLIDRWPKATFVEDPMFLRPWVDAAFPQQNSDATPNQTRDYKLFLIGAPFQIKVWEALLRIPTGHVSTYGEIASAIGSPLAVRAVGTAVGRNPISWLIPCHRALRKGGGLGGYHWGMPVKRALLAWESARDDARHTES